MGTRLSWKLKNCQTNQHEKCLNSKNRCRCYCHNPSKINSIDTKPLTQVGIIPKTFCPECKINYYKEYDACIKCDRNLIRKYPTQKKQYKDPTGRIDFLMHEKRIKESEEQKHKRDKINHIYHLGRARARYCFGIRSCKFWDKKATERLVHKFAIDEVHQHLGHKWSPWERKWKE